MRKVHLVRAVILAGALLFLGWMILFIASGESERSRKQVRVGESAITVWTATNPDEWTQGLSGTQQATLGADGMFFVFPDKHIRNFWMKEMSYPLDVMWISDGRIVKISENVPIPVADQEIPRMSSDPFEVEGVLEVPAGTVAAKSWKVGDIVLLTY